MKTIERAITANMLFAWVIADAVYGVGDIVQVPCRSGKSYVLGLEGDRRSGSCGGKSVAAGTDAPIMGEFDSAASRRVSAG